MRFSYIALPGLCSTRFNNSGVGETVRRGAHPFALCEGMGSPPFPPSPISG